MWAFSYALTFKKKSARRALPLSPKGAAPYKPEALAEFPGDEDARTWREKETDTHAAWWLIQHTAAASGGWVGAAAVCLRRGRGLVLLGRRLAGWICRADSGRDK